MKTDIPVRISDVPEDTIKKLTDELWKRDAKNTKKEMEKPKVHTIGGKDGIDGKVFAIMILSLVAIVFGAGYLSKDSTINDAKDDAKRHASHIFSLMSQKIDDEKAICNDKSVLAKNQVAFTGIALIDAVDCSKF